MKRTELKKIKFFHHVSYVLPHKNQFLDFPSCVCIENTQILFMSATDIKTEKKKRDRKIVENDKMLNYMQARQTHRTRPYTSRWREQTDKNTENAV